jgi:hypothetical protein
MLWREFSSPHGAGGIFTGLHNQNPRAFVDVSSEQNLCSWIIKIDVHGFFYKPTWFIHID